MKRARQISAGGISVSIASVRSFWKRSDSRVIKIGYGVRQEMVYLGTGIRGERGGRCGDQEHLWVLSMGLIEALGG